LFFEFGPVIARQELKAELESTGASSYSNYDEESIDRVSASPRALSRCAMNPTKKRPTPSQPHCGQQNGATSADSVGLLPGLRDV